jgi:hypothetical protein
MRARRALRRSAGALAALLLAASGCASDGGLQATTVLDHDQCHHLEPGLTRVDWDTVAAIRGSTLLGMTRPPEQQSTGQDPLLVALSRGQQPTPGYGFTLEGAHRQGDMAVIEVRWRTPAGDALLPQVITHPCLVVGLSGAAPERVEARDQTGQVLGSVTLRESAP